MKYISIDQKKLNGIIRTVESDRCGKIDLNIRPNKAPWDFFEIVFFVFEVFGRFYAYMQFHKCEFQFSKFEN